MDGWRSLVGYSPWGSKELDTTERLHFHFHFVTSLTLKEHNYATGNRSMEDSVVQASCSCLVLASLGVGRSLEEF